MCERGGLRLHTKSFKSPEALGGRHVPSGKLIMTRTREIKIKQKKKPEGRRAPTAKTAERLEERERTHVCCPPLHHRTHDLETQTSASPRHLPLARRVLRTAIWTLRAGFGHLFKWPNRVNPPVMYQRGVRGGRRLKPNNLALLERRRPT